MMSTNPDADYYDEDESETAAVTVRELSGACHKVPIAEADTGDSLLKKVRAAMSLPGASPLLYLFSSDGTPIEARATLAAQGIGNGADVAVTVEEMLQHSYTQATLQGHTEAVLAV